MTGLVSVPNGRRMMEDAERGKWTQRVLAYLNHEKRRCTYGALGGVLNVPAQKVGDYLGMRRPQASWVVCKATGLPTGYTEDQLAEDFPSKPIECPDELRRLVDGHDDGGGMSHFAPKRNPCEES